MILSGQASQTIAVSAIALFLPLIRTDLSLSYSQAGSLAVASTATYALMQVPTGYLTDRIDPKRLFIIGAVGVNLLLFGFAVAPSFGWLLADQAASGVFRSFMFAPGILLITSQFTSSRTATAMGLYVASGFATTVGLNALGPLLVGPLGWPALLTIFAAAGLLMALLHWWSPDAGPHRATARQHGIRDLLAAARQRIMVLCSIIQFIRLAVMLGLRFWMPTYLVTARHLSLSTAGLVLAGGATLTAVANFAGGYVSDRVGRPVSVIVVSLIALAVTTVGVAALPGLATMLIAYAIQSLFVQAYFGPLFGVPLRVLGPSVGGSTTGISNFWANVGGLCSTYLLGAVREASGSFVPGFVVLAGLCVVGALTAVVLRAELRRAPRPADGPHVR